MDTIITDFEWAIRKIRMCFLTTSIHNVLKKDPQNKELR